ncbi:HU family DNA-binding protein [uncultured Roseovarius sp.]|uniref:HU family DNA-binding protein n=1 Tax=uncultured Roseovarius sp. TaxID=293344 RepID=UPI00262CAB44|nr:HU family DNA-binding protein [uncultured Roseovarius sp.]
MSAKSTSSTSKTTGKTATKSKAKAAAKPKSRLAGPKPPKARATAAKTGTVSKPVTAASVAAARDAKASTSKIPAPDMSKKPEIGLPVELKKRELIDLVVAKSDIKKKYAKPVVEALLEVLGETLAKGRELNLQPLGKLKYNRTKETTSARIIVAKIRQSKPTKTSASPTQDTVADAAE